MKKKFTERRKHWGWVQAILNMHSSESQTSWMRWIGTGVISNIMFFWSMNCLFDDNMKLHFTLEEMPTNLAGIIGLVLLGKVGQSYVEGKNGKG